MPVADCEEPCPLPALDPVDELYGLIYRKLHGEEEWWAVLEEQMGYRWGNPVSSVGAATSTLIEEIGTRVWNWWNPPE